MVFANGEISTWSENSFAQGQQDIYVRNNTNRTIVVDHVQVTGSNIWDQPMTETLSPGQQTVCCTVGQQNSSQAWSYHWTVTWHYWP
jgi:hypothetical protein